MLTRKRILVLLSMVVLPSCDQTARRTAPVAADSTAGQTADSLARARQDSINRASPGYIIDSLLPIEEEIRRFRAALGGATVAALVNASQTRESLFTRFVGAVEARDTAALQAMHVTAREFIELVYPESPFTRPPYRQAPRIRWGIIELSSSQGLSRLMERRSGKPLGALGMKCGPTPVREGANLIWNECLVRIRDANGGEHSERLFGGIIERDGRFKFLSYANQY